MTDADCTPGREPRSVAASACLILALSPSVTTNDKLDGIPSTTVMANYCIIIRHGGGRDSNLMSAESLVREN